jgi:hypothetical protein
MLARRDGGWQIDDDSHVTRDHHGVLVLLGLTTPAGHWGIGITAIIVIGVVLLAEWWRWEQKIK